MRKRYFSTEAAYLLGIPALALGTALMERADFGVSMVVAPAYVLYRKLSLTLPFFTFGRTEYLLQTVLLAALMLALRRFRPAYFFSFVTAVCYGFALDGAMALAALLPLSVPARLGWYCLGMALCAVGVALLFHTYLAPEVYELAVKELARSRGWEIHRVKTCYDCASCLLGVLLSLLFFRGFVGVRLGTILCALVNGTLIGACSAFLEAHWEFRDLLPLRRFFEAPQRSSGCS